ncbi:MAG: LemA family protein [Chloroflexi bacterium]|nr:MAG: LemA family protein [Chloroflexota bacterium]RLC95636.1 MAG: LemA family protein [Chloroflexota bacterium]
MIALYVVIGVLVVLLILVVLNFNSLVRLRNQTQNAWSQIDVQLKRRHDLIPNLVETAKGYMAHERETLEAVTNARNLAQGAIGKGIDAQAKAEGELGGALSRLLAVAENYPDLKANQNFLALQEELTSTENKIAFSRQFYNDSILRYNNKIQMFPSSVIAAMTGFKAGEFFEIEVGTEREAPKVSFA